MSVKLFLNALRIRFKTGFCSVTGHKEKQLYSSGNPFIVCDKCMKYIREGLV